MNEEFIFLSPDNGWLNFEKHVAVEDKIWNSLKITDKGGKWHYTSFTSWSADWWLDSEDENELHLEYEEYTGPDTDEDIDLPIRKLYLRLTPSDNEEYEKLVKLVEELKVEFGIV